MNKNIYIAPNTELVQLDPQECMKVTGSASLPSVPGAAPARSGAVQNTLIKV